MKFALFLGILLVSGLAFSEEIKEGPKDDDHLVNNEEESAVDSQDESEDATKENSAPEETLEDSESDSEGMEQEDDNNVALSDDENEVDEDENEEDFETEDPKVSKPYKQCKSAEVTLDLLSRGHQSIGKCLFIANIDKGNT